MAYSVDRSGAIGGILLAGISIDLSLETVEGGRAGVQRRDKLVKERSEILLSSGVTVDEAICRCTVAFSGRICSMHVKAYQFVAESRQCWTGVCRGPQGRQ